MRWSAGLLAACLAAVGLQAHPFVQASDQAKMPGEVISVHFQDPDGAIPKTLTGLSQEAGFYFWEAGQAWVALLAVPWSAKAGQQRLTLMYQGPEGPGSLKLSVTLRSRPKGSRVTIRLPPARAKKAWAGLAKEKDLLADLLKEPASPPLWRGYFRRPVQGSVSSPFGQARTYMPGRRRGDHKGEDLAAPLGTPVFAANDGTVRLANEQLAGHGGSVVLDHGYGLRSLYFHMSQVPVKPGHFIKKGELIGYVGSEGLSSGAHLHWQINLGPHPVDPAAWLEKPVRMGL